MTLNAQSFDSVPETHLGTKPKRLIVLGAGYVGGALARCALARGWSVATLTRNPATAKDLLAAGCEVVVGDLGSSDWWSAPCMVDGAEHIAVTVASGGGGVEGYRRSYVDGLRSILAWGNSLIRRAARDPGICVAAGHLIYTSSTSVYPQGGGALVSEADQVGGDEETVQVLIEAERLALAWPGVAATVLRLAGIYGPDRTHLIGQVRAGEVAGWPVSHLNLIHRDDALSAMFAAWEHGSGAGGAFNISDGEGATKGDVAAWLGEQLGVCIPRFTGKPAGGRRGITPDRVIDNRLAREKLGWSPQFKTFRDGYADLVRASMRDGG